MVRADLCSAVDRRQRQHPSRTGEARQGRHKPLGIFDVLDHLKRSHQIKLLAFPGL